LIKNRIPEGNLLIYEETYTLSKTMSREKKSQVDDITVLRRILDNSSDPSLSHLISKEDHALDSVRKRLHGYLYEPHEPIPRYPLVSDSMEPKVTIRTKHTLHPPRLTQPPKFQPSLPLPEFNLVTPAALTPTIPPSEISFLDEELFEVEKIDKRIPEFLEITPKENEQESLVDESMVQPLETSPSESNLPEWQPVDEEHILESSETSEPTPVARIPEFEKINLPSEPGEYRELPLETSLTKPDEPVFQKLTWRQERTEKKALRKKEKEEKKLRKIEQKRLKKEQQRTETTQIDEEPTTFNQSEETPSFEIVMQEEDHIHQIQVNYNNFNGIESIDEKTAEILYKNGYFSIENLREATVDDLVQIHGIKRGLAKQIKKEIDEHVQETDVSEFTPVKQRKTRKKEKKKSLDSSEWELSPSKEKTPSIPEICTYKGFTLYKREKRTSDGEKTIIHYFSKRKSERGEPTLLPDGYRIVVNRETGVPYLKKK